MRLGSTGSDLISVRSVVHPAGCFPGQPSEPSEPKEKKEPTAPTAHKLQHAGCSQFHFLHLRVLLYVTGYRKCTLDNVCYAGYIRQRMLVPL